MFHLLIIVLLEKKREDINDEEWFNHGFNMGTRMVNDMLKSINLKTILIEFGHSIFSSTQCIKKKES